MKMFILLSMLLPLLLNINEQREWYQHDSRIGSPLFVFLPNNSNLAAICGQKYLYGSFEAQIGWPFWEGSLVPRWPAPIADSLTMHDLGSDSKTAPFPVFLPTAWSVLGSTTGIIYQGSWEEAEGKKWPAKNAVVSQAVL
jgi:hypothetical protein